MKTTLLGVLLLAPFFLFAQHQYDRCASYDVINNWEQQYPGTRQALDEVIFNAQKHSQHQGKRSGARAADTIYRIPVVVHVVYTTPAENLPDSIIESQIEVLNQAFRRDNADTSDTRAEFKPFAGDAGIEFYLADLDPNGMPTNGITRTVGNPPPFLGFSPFGDEVKKNSTGGKDPWPTDRYLNIWVCNLFNGLGVLGYAYPPVGNLSNWPAGSAPADTSLQGVVIYHEVFGYKNPLAVNSQFYNIAAEGKTCVHEVAHYLGLRHIWGDGACNEDDFVADTPEASDNSQQQCDWNLNQCSPTCPLLPDYPNMIENYMDYSADSCMNMFSYGQIAIMRGVLATYRNRLPEITFGTIKPPYGNTGSNTFVVSTADSLVVTIDFTRFQNGTAYPYTFSVGDSLYSSIVGSFLAADCDQVVLYPGDYLVTPSGDTLYFNPGDTVTTYTDGTVLVSPYIETVGVGNVAALSFKVYPNPANDMVYISTKNGAQLHSVTMLNLLGEVVAQQLVSNNNATIDVSQLTPGIYLVQVNTSEGLQTQRVVVE